MGKGCRQIPLYLPAAVSKRALGPWSAEYNSLASFASAWDSLPDFFLPTCISSTKTKPPLLYSLSALGSLLLSGKVYCLRYHLHALVLRAEKRWRLKKFVLGHPDSLTSKANRQCHWAQNFSSNFILLTAARAIIKTPPKLSKSIWQYAGNARSIYCNCRRAKRFFSKIKDL